MLTRTVSFLSILLILCVIPIVWLVYKKRIRFFSGVFLGTFLFLMSFICSMYCVHLEYGYSPIDMLLESSITRTVSMYSSMPGMSAEDVHAITVSMEQMMNLYKLYLPAFLVLGNLLWVYIIFMVVKGVFAIFGKDVSGFAKFCDLKMSRMAVVLSVISLILSKCIQNPRGSYAFANFFLIIIIVSAICGLSAVDFALRKKIKISAIRMVIYIAVIFSVSFLWGTVLPVAGMIDAFLDFRKIRQNSI